MLRMTSTKSQYLCASIVALIFVRANCDGIDSDSDLYSEEMYQQLKEEYSENMLKKDTVSAKVIPVGSSDDQSPNDDTESVMLHHALLPVTTESYPGAIERLSCDNPWFWNTFKCVWLDVTNRNISDRTRKNGKVVAYIAGPPITILAGICCFVTCTFCIYSSRLKKFKKLMSTYQEKYKPGTIILPTGEVKTFPPTAQEEEALDDVMLTLTSVV